MSEPTWWGVTPADVSALRAGGLLRVQVLAMGVLCVLGVAGTVRHETTRYGLTWFGDPAFRISATCEGTHEETDDEMRMFVTLMLLKRYRGFETRLTGRHLDRVFPDGVPQPIVMKVKV